MTDKNVKIILERGGFQPIEHATIGMSKYPVFMIKYKNGDMVELPINDIIFNHAFAIAFFGNNEVCESCGKITQEYCHCNLSALKRAWEFYLPKMVLEENPIQYLVKFL